MGFVKWLAGLDAFAKCIPTITALEASIPFTNAMKSGFTKRNMPILEQRSLFAFVHLGCEKGS
ncbi:MAG: hypothetical protein QXF24_06450 [Thermoproteota archaeon]